MVDTHPLPKDWSRIQEEIQSAAEKLEKFHNYEESLWAKFQHVESALEELKEEIEAQIFSE